MPGLGTFGIDAIIARDYQQVQGFALLTALAFVGHQPARRPDLHVPGSADPVRLGAHGRRRAPPERGPSAAAACSEAELPADRRRLAGGDATRSESPLRPGGAPAPAQHDRARRRRHRRLLLVVVAIFADVLAPQSPIATRPDPDLPAPELGASAGHRSARPRHAEPRHPRHAHLAAGGRVVGAAGPLRRRAARDDRRLLRRPRGHAGDAGRWT